MTTKTVLDEMKVKQAAIKAAIKEAKKFADANGVTFDVDIDGLYSATYHGKAHPYRTAHQQPADRFDYETENGFVSEVVQNHSGWLSSSMTC